MKLLAVLALATTLTQAFAAQEFGGMKFHSTVEREQFEAMRTDLKYLYQNPVTTVDAEFLRVAQLSANNGPEMHNWLLNRIRYIIGERYTLDDNNVLQAAGKFPATPLPDAPEEEESPNKNSPRKGGEEPSPDIKTVMTNMGGALYTLGKEHNIFFGIKFDGEVVYVTSPRTGVLQVGEGLFDPNFRYNANLVAPSNSVSRLATLFHEARHSDGTGKSTSFGHSLCPKGHLYFGHYACESSSNGSYTIGALSQRSLLNNCGGCSAKEKTALTAAVADSFSRLIKADNALKIAQTRKTIETYSKLLGTYKGLLNVEGVNKTTIQLEIRRLEAEIIRLNADLRTLQAQSSSTQLLPLDPNPEGIWTPVTLQKSKEMMEKSLKK